MRSESSPVVSRVMLEKPMRGQSISTDAIRENGMVFSLLLNNPGSSMITPISLISICAGKMRFPSVKREATKIFGSEDILRVNYYAQIIDN